MITSLHHPLPEAVTAPGRRSFVSAPTEVTVREVRTKADRRAFVDFPWSLYSNDAQWCPPLKLQVHEFIDQGKHPFYKHGAAVQLLAERNGRVVGRINVSDDPNYNAEHGTNTGCFGMFESVNDYEVSRALFTRGASWLRGCGRTAVMGPIDYSTNYPAGLLIDGFDTPQRVMMNHNPRYYADLIEDWGFGKAKDLLAWWFDHDNPTLTRWKGRMDRIAKRAGVTVRPLRMNDFDADVARCQHVYNEMWETHWGFVKMTPAEFRHLALELKQLAVPDLILLAERAGTPVGFCVTLPDLNEALRPIDGRLTTYGMPIGLAKLLWNLRRIKTARMAVLGVLPGYRKQGIAELMILKAFEHGTTKLGYTGAELGWTLEENEIISHTVESVGARRYKRFRVYERSL